MISAGPETRTGPRGAPELTWQQAGKRSCLGSGCPLDRAGNRREQTL